MTKEFIPINNTVPDGLLHDQRLKSAELCDSTLKLVFDIELYEQNHDKKWHEKFKKFKTCTMTVKLGKNEYKEDSVFFETVMSTKNKYYGWRTELEKFVDFVNNSGAEITYLYISNILSFAEIYFSVSTYPIKDVSKYKDYKKYAECKLHIETELITFEWE